jgi:hypothetical protein
MLDERQLLSALGPPLLAQTDDPHAELLTLFWGPQFDRDHALALWSQCFERQPLEAAPLLPQLLLLGERFDSLQLAEQQRLRRLIVRHRVQHRDWAA